MDGNSNRRNMPSKKKKVKGKGRGAARNRKESSKDKAAEAKGDDVKNDVTSQVRRLKIQNISQDDENEEALLEKAINLAAAEREELEAAEAAGCDHGFVALPDSLGMFPPKPLEEEERWCAEFTDSFMSEFMSTKESCIGDRFLIAVEATKSAYFGVWNDPQTMQQKRIYNLAKGVDAILEKRLDDARQSAILASFLEQYRAAFISKIDFEVFSSWKQFNLHNAMRGGTRIHKDDPAWNWSKISELSNDDCDEHTIVSFFRKRVPCKCLDRRYKEVKSIVKMGTCCNPSCPLQDRKVECSKLLYCSKCFTASFCSSKCQKAAWPKHKEQCGALDQVPEKFKYSVCLD